MESRYCICYDRAAEGLLNESLPAIARDVNKCEASNIIRFFALGGGYGRGDGGIRRNADGTAGLYNDLDFFVIVYDNASKTDVENLESHLRQVAESWTKKLGIDVDFSAPRTVSYIASRLDQMMWKEMAMGTKIITGSQSDFEKTFKSAAATPLRRGEAAKLIFNRSYGLLLAKKRLAQPDLKYADFDFIARNINKALLACADVLLLRGGFAPYKISEKKEDFKKLKLDGFSNAEEMKSAFERAVKFKTEPEISDNLNELGQKCSQAEILTLSVIKYADIFLRKSGKIGIWCIIRNIKNNLFLAKKFKAEDVAFSPLQNPVFTALEIIKKLLAPKKVPTDSQMENLTEIWKAIN